jgi:hypothetical protein
VRLLFGFMPETARDFNQSTGDFAVKLTICKYFNHNQSFLKAARMCNVTSETPCEGCCTLGMKDSWLNQGGTRGITF